MPNGGSDCCGTCWFNAKNEGEEGYAHASDPGPSFCTIRQLAIEWPFYTYCGNHPHRRPERDPIPIGPVFVGNSEGERRVLVPSPDTEEIRRHLLALLATIGAEPREQYPIGIQLEELVVRQLGDFREERAADGLRSLASLGSADGSRDVPRLVEVARRALSQIVGP